MKTEKTITITIELDDEAAIDPGDLFYFEQSGSNLPTVYRHQGRKGEDWDGYRNSLTGEKSYIKVAGVQGILIRPFVGAVDSLLNSERNPEPSVARDDASSNPS